MKRSCRKTPAMIICNVAFDCNFYSLGTVEVRAVTFDERGEAFRADWEPRAEGKSPSFSPIPGENSTGDDGGIDSSAVRSTDGANPEAICAEMSGNPTLFDRGTEKRQFLNDRTFVIRHFLVNTKGFFFATLSLPYDSKIASKLTLNKG